MQHSTCALQQALDCTAALAEGAAALSGYPPASSSYGMRVCVCVYKCMYVRVCMYSHVTQGAAALLEYPPTSSSGGTCVSVFYVGTSVCMYAYVCTYMSHKALLRFQDTLLHPLHMVRVCVCVSMYMYICMYNVCVIFFLICHTGCCCSVRISRLLKMIGLFCKRALKRDYMPSCILSLWCVCLCVCVCVCERENNRERK